MTNRQLYKRVPVRPRPTQAAYHSFNTSFSAFILRGYGVLCFLLFFLAISDTPVIGQCPPPTTTNPTNNGLHFDGTNDYVTINSCSGGVIFPGGNAITIEYWFKGANMQSAVRMQSLNGNYIVAGWQNSKHILSNSEGTTGGVAVGRNATDGNWHHVAVSWHQGGKFTSYLDGVLIEQKPATLTPLPSFNADVYLGALDGTSEFMNGTLDEVRVWTVTRTQAQIQAALYTCSPSDQTGLLMFYKFNQGVANSANAGITGLLNSASNDLHGVLTSFNLATTTNWVTGFPLNIGISIVTSPTLSGSQCVGNSPTLTTKATTNVLTTLLWQYKAAGASNYTDIESSAYTSNAVETYTIPPLSTTDNGAMYRAVFRAFCDDVATDVVSNAVTVNVAPITTRLYVKANATGGNTGLDWTNAFADLQSALNYPCTATLTEIWVAKGTYKPTTTTTARNAAFAMKAGVQMYGSFEGTETLLSERTPSVRAANLSILSGDIDEATDPLVVSGSGGSLSISGNSGNSYSVVLNDGNALTNTAVLDGFTISGASRSGMYNSYSSPSVRNVTFKFNHSDEGGGMYNFVASPNLFNVIFESNTGRKGGGMHSKSSDVTLNDVVFIGNYAVSGGGISGNSANEFISSTTFVNNYAISGGGIYIQSGSVYISNSIFWGNRETIGSTVSNIDGFVQRITYSDVEGGYAGTGNINQDPLFVNVANPAGADRLFGTADDGLALTACSPAVNAGSSPFVATDIVGNARIFGGTVDMGAYELQTAALLNATSPITTNNALNFDGTNDYVQINNCNNNALTNTDALTIEYWFKGASNHSAVRLQPDNTSYIIAGYFSGATGLHLVRLNNVPYSVAMGNTTDGNWHHVAMTWQRNTTNGFKSYLDGALVAQTTTPNVALPVITSGMFLGSRSGVAEFSIGSIDEVRVWGVARTQAEIQAGMNPCTFTLPQTGLVLYYEFDHGSVGGSNGAINTLVNSANTATFPALLNNFALTGANSNWTTGYELSAPPTTTNNALNFDGTNDYVQINKCSGSLFAGGDAITIEYWFKGSSNQSAVRMQSGSEWIIAGYNGTHILSNDGGLTGISVGTGYNDGNWHHIAMTWQRGGLFTSYLDGVEVAQRAASNTPLPAFNAGVYLGCFGGTAEFMNGSLDEVRVWTTARTQAQLQANMSACTLLDQTNLLMYYQFNHGAASGTNTSINTLLNGVNPIELTGTLNGFSLSSTSSNWTTGKSCGAPLAVELLDFKGTPQYNGNFLTWTTASEVNNKGFQVERLMDNGQWATLRFVNAKGKAATYDFVDNSPLSKSYYRLRQIDNDGKETLSKMVFVSRNASTKLKAYPNPVSNTLTIETESTGDYHILNLLGQQVLSGKAAQRIDVSALPEGTYFLKVGMEQVKFVKQ